MSDKRRFDGVAALHAHPCMTSMPMHKHPSALWRPPTPCRHPNTPKHTPPTHAGACIAPTRLYTSPCTPHMPHTYMRYVQPPPGLLLTLCTTPWLWHSLIAPSTPRITAATTHSGSGPHCAAMKMRAGRTTEGRVQMRGDLVLWGGGAWVAGCCLHDLVRAHHQPSRAMLYAVRLHSCLPTQNSVLVGDGVVDGARDAIAPAAAPQRRRRHTSPRQDRPRCRPQRGRAAAPRSVRWCCKWPGRGPAGGD